MAQPSDASGHHRPTNLLGVLSIINLAAPPRKAHSRRVHTTSGGKDETINSTQSREDAPDGGGRGVAEALEGKPRGGAVVLGEVQDLLERVNDSAPARVDAEVVDGLVEVGDVRRNVLLPEVFSARTAMAADAAWVRMVLGNTRHQRALAGCRARATHPPAHSAKPPLPHGTTYAATTHRHALGTSSRGHTTHLRKKLMRNFACSSRESTRGPRVVMFWRRATPETSMMLLERRTPLMPSSSSTWYTLWYAGSSAPRCVRTVCSSSYRANGRSRDLLLNSTAAPLQTGKDNVRVRASAYRSC